MPKHFYAKFKGDNELGIPNGFGKMVFSSVNEGDDDEEGQEWVASRGDEINLPRLRQKFQGDFKKGYFVHGHMEYHNHSFYVGDFNPINNKYHGVGRFSFSKDIYYQGQW
mmetsp:Transcript_9997/g.15134  ORF Transcript_9997/g.15134 Transcript_9997/m.15134 type:complete len:110 (-) Transcript_9997:3346-3675(-)